MKKKVLLIAALFTAGFSFAQDQMTSKKGTPILPEAGDYAIGFDASGLTDYAGNLFNGAAGNGISGLNLLNNSLEQGQMIYGKYFKDANTAYRGMVRLGYSTKTNKALLDDVTSTNIPKEQVEQEEKINEMNITIGGGLEYRRGKGRLQGVYGPMALISLGSKTTSYTYGNSLSATYQAHNSQFGQGAGVTENKQGSTFGLDLGGFAGVEYFFAPKISVGAEIMWTIRLESTGAGEETDEAWDAVNNGVRTQTNKRAGKSSFSFDNRPMGNLNLNFHF